MQKQKIRRVLTKKTYEPNDQLNSMYEEELVKFI